MVKNLKGAATAILIGAFVTPCFASESTVNFSGIFAFIDFDESFLDFETPGMGMAPGARVAYETGTFFDGLSFGDPVAVSDFYYDNSVTPQTVWESGDYSFTLDTVTMVREDIEGTPAGVDIDGTGTVTDGTTTLAGKWNIRLTGTLFEDAEFLELDDLGNIEDKAEEYGNIFTFTSTTVTDVPEPGSLALIGLGLVGVGVARRKQGKSFA